MPFDGVFRFTDILRRKEALARELDADWLMHCDVDEIRQAPSPWSTLADGIAEVDREGFNAINFDEFVFLPVGDERFEGADFVAEMRHYYYFHPAPDHRINAWKNIGPVDLVTHSGHRVEFPGRRVYPESFILRHYIALSRVHALAKYATRVHDADRIRRTSWNAPRVAFQPAHLRLPERSELTEYRGDDAWDRSRPLAHSPVPRPAPRRPPPPTACRRCPRRRGRAGGPRRLFSGRRAGPDPETAPLPFIVGSPRSGTTLLRLMLDAHPLLTIPPETHFLPAVLELTGAGEALRQAFLRCIVDGPRWNDFHLSEETFERRLQAIEPFDLTHGLHAFYRMYGERQQKPRWGDKTPGYVLHLRRIAGVLPTARFIHLIRDGRDVAASLRKLWWGPGRRHRGPSGRLALAHPRGAAAGPGLPALSRDPLRGPRARPAPDAGEALRIPRSALHRRDARLPSAGGRAPGRALRPIRGER